MPAADEPAPHIGQTGARFGRVPRRRRGGVRMSGAEVSGGVGPGEPGPAPAPGPFADAGASGGGAATATEGPVSGEELAIGRTGARFAGAARPPRRATRPRPRPSVGIPPGTGGATRRDAGRTAPLDPGPTAQRDPGPPAQGPAGSPAPPDAANGSEPAAPVLPDLIPDPAPDGLDTVGGAGGRGDRWPAGPVARPYVLTAGRTRPAVDLPLEAMVSAAPTAPRAPVTAEQEAVLALCRQPRSVAEVAALLGLAVGVARVLVGDLAAGGALVRHRTARSTGPDLDLLERVLAGLRRL